MKSVTAHSLGECVQACAATDGCVDVSLSGTACYLKSTRGQREKNGSINGAKLVSKGPSKVKQYGNYATNVHTAYVTETVRAQHAHRHAARHIHRFAT
jgi:hypothetical protein